MLVRRSHAPKRVTRGSFSILKTGPLIWLKAFNSSRSISAPDLIDRNLYIVNGRPWSPALCCLKMTGPGDVSFTPAAMSKKNGERTARLAKASVLSIADLTSKAQESSGVTRKTITGAAPKVS